MKAHGSILSYALFAAIPVVLLAAACSKKDGGAGSTSTTSADSVSGDCAFVKDKPRCQPGGKAAVCRMNKAKNMKVEWATLSCPDCEADDKGVKCSSYTNGDPCDFSMSSGCNADGKTAYSCDFQSGTIQLKPCPGGCKEPKGGGGYSCN